jgi:hypothetical protein
MKSLKFVLVALLLVVASMAYSQTVAPVFFKTIDNKNYNFSYEGSLRTTDSTTYHTIGTLGIGANEVGVIEVEVVGIDTTTTAGFCTGKQIVTYSKKAGTLTLGTPTNILAATTSASMTTSAFQITTASNNIIVQVKGTLNREILWTARVKFIRKIKPS